MKLSHAIVVLALAATSAWGQWMDPQTAKPLPDLEWRKTVGGLGGMLVLTKDYESFMKQWTSTGESRVPELHPAAGATRGESVTAMVFFSGCAEAGKNCELVVDFKVLKPDGSTYGSIPKVAAYNAKIVKPDVVMLSRATIKLDIEPKDPVGSYTIIATLRQPDAKRSMELKQTLWVE